MAMARLVNDQSGGKVGEANAGIVTGPFWVDGVEKGLEGRREP